ncbi:hypothetical protein Tco_1437381 [Tanacetum coccineum]
MSITYLIILSDYEEEFENSSAIVPKYTSPTYMPMFDNETEPFEDKPMDTKLYESEPEPGDETSEEDPSEDEE